MTLDSVYVNADGTIRWDGDPIGRVMKTEEGLARELGQWRAEVGSPAAPEAWPRWVACYAKTRKAAVGAVLDGLEVPPEEGIQHGPEEHSWGEWSAAYGGRERRECFCGAFQDREASR
jgi:hypothetical protein